MEKEPFTYYRVKFIGNVNEKIRPWGFPKEVAIDFFYQVRNFKELRILINEQAKTIMTQQCMVVLRDIQNQDMNKQFDNWQIIPLSMLTDIYTVTKKIEGEVPTVGEDGGASLQDGTRIPIQ